jgi:hypothetical protein
LLDGPSVSAVEAIARMTRTLRDDRELILEKSP